MLIPAAAMALLVVSLWWWATPRDVDIATPLEPAIATESFLTAPPELADIALPDEPVIVDAGDKLRQKWRLSGILKIDGASVMILNDRHDKSSRRVSAKDDLDGWAVMDAGSNYAVFSQGGEEVRLVLNEETVR
jgi:hypothetical protein